MSDQAKPTPRRDHAALLVACSLLARSHADAARLAQSRGRRALGESLAKTAAVYQGIGEALAADEIAHLALMAELELTLGPDEGPAPVKRPGRPELHVIRGGVRNDPGNS